MLSLFQPFLFLSLDRIERGLISYEDTIDRAIRTIADRNGVSCDEELDGLRISENLTSHAQVR